MNAQDLKNSILQLAIQGKLVEQRQEEGAAKELMKEIKAEKERLIKEKKIKKEKTLAEITEDEVPFEIPESWEWVRLGDCVSNKSGVSYKKDNLNVISHNMIRIFRGGNISDLAYTFKDDDVMLDCSFVKTELLLKKNILITPAVTSLEHIGKMARIELDYTDVAVGGFVLMLIPHISIDVLSQYLLFALSSQYHRNLCRSITNKSGQAFYNLSREKLMSILVPIPPLEEQKRIVAKIEELIPYIEKYGEAHSKLEEFNKKFPEDMQKSILQYAIQGKLVEQREEEGTAEELYKKIQEEKEKLIKEKKIKKEKPLAEITEDEVPFEIPENWKWVRLLDVCEYIQRGKSPKYSDIQKYPVVAQKCNQWDGFSIEKAKFIDPDTINKYTPERFLQDGDLMWNSTGLGTLGRMAIYYVVLNPYEFAVADSHVTVIRALKEFISYKYLYYYFANPSVQNVIENQSDGSTKQKELATSTIKKYFVPLPPLAEQKRIVAKIEELLPYCKQLVK